MKNVEIYLKMDEINGLTGLFIDDMFILMKILNNKKIATIIIKVK
ncbi:hypothetical protein [Clostridium algidicarnis]|nr:hypothetical protein [Clostridium algidicarnis]